MPKGSKQAKDDAPKPHGLTTWDHRINGPQAESISGNGWGVASCIISS